MTIAERMLLIRAKKNLTQKQLDALLGIPIGSTHRIESEQHKVHKAREIRLIMKIEEMEKNENV